MASDRNKSIVIAGLTRNPDERKEKFGKVFEKVNF